MLNINLHPRDLNMSTKQRIWAVFFIEKVRIKIDTNQFILPKNWSKDKQKVLSSYKEHEVLNQILKEQVEYIENYLNKLKLKKKRFYKDALKEEK